jgi:hypothetical protein
VQEQVQAQELALVLAIWLEQWEALQPLQQHSQT